MCIPTHWGAWLLVNSPGLLIGIAKATGRPRREALPRQPGGTGRASWSLRGAEVQHSGLFGQALPIFTPRSSFLSLLIWDLGQRSSSGAAAEASSQGSGVNLEDIFSPFWLSIQYVSTPSLYPSSTPESIKLRELFVRAPSTVRWPPWMCCSTWPLAGASFQGEKWTGSQRFLWV